MTVFPDADTSGEPGPAGPTQASADLTADQVASLARIIESALHRRLDRPLSASLLSGGRSNLTYRVSGGGEQWVMRRPPLGHVLETAHDMHREYCVMHALAPTAVPVPDTVCYIQDRSVLGAEFYVMDLVDGVVYRTAEEMAALSPASAQALSYAFIDSMADLHLVDYAAAGLADFGRPDGYLERQVRRWTRQLAASRSRDIAGFDELGARLAAFIPPSTRVSIVHGDFRLDNAIVDRADPSRIMAILDWEMATLGDPLSDLGLFYLYWEGWGGLDNPIAATPAEIPGYPSWSSLAERYASRTGTKLSDFDWYESFAIFKFAVICEGIYYRHINGLAVGEGFDKIGAMVPELVLRGNAALRR
jgi:aminoglycoside phosphotransferase (APT) family kinase protein